MNPLFDLPDQQHKGATRWVVFYTHNKTEYLGRRVPSRATFEWLPAQALGRKLPTRWKRFGDAARIASDFNQRITSAGTCAGVWVRVRAWHEQR